MKPSGPLLDWLNHLGLAKSGSRRRLRLPVVVRFTDAYRLGIGEAFAASSEEDLDAGSIQLSLDDSGMSNPLLSVLDDLCPKPGVACTVWLEGLWGPLLADLPGLKVEEAGGSPIRWPFAVLKVNGLVHSPPEHGTPVRAFVEDDRTK